MGEQNVTCVETTARATTDPDAVSAYALDALSLDLVMSASRFVRRAGRVSGTPHSATAWQSLAELDIRGGLRVSDLAHLQHVAQPTMTSLMNRLEHDGWVTRVPDPGDARASKILLTDLGRSELEGYRAASAARVRPLLGELTEAERAKLAQAADLLARLAARADP